MGGVEGEGGGGVKWNELEEGREQGREEGEERKGMETRRKEGGRGKKGDAGV